LNCFVLNNCINVVVRFFFHMRSIFNWIYFLILFICCKFVWVDFFILFSKHFEYIL
jgi:hypothetical protein